MAKNKAWAKFPHETKPFDYAGDKLQKNWARLHAGDCELFPDETRVAALVKAGKLGEIGDLAALAETLQNAWRAYHRGDFRKAFDEARALGPIGASVAIKAAGIHAIYLVDDEEEQLKRFDELAALAEAATRIFPEEANTHYRRAFALGRYSQGISITKALSMGLAGKVKESLDRTLKLAPKHAEAHTALGLYHCEVVSKVGGMLAGLTYGAKAATGEALLAKAIELTPDSPIAHIEYGNGLMLLYGDRREDDAAAAYEKAAGLKPKDAMEKLDVEYARAQLED